MLEQRAEMVNEIKHETIQYTKQSYTMMNLHWTLYNCSTYYLRQGGYVFGSVCLFVCLQDNAKSYERILIKFGWTRNKWLDFGDVLADTDEMRGWNGF